MDDDSQKPRSKHTEPMAVMEPSHTKRTKPDVVIDWAIEGRTETLKALWIEGKSASYCARAIGAGCTRCMVLGKVRRLKRAGLLVCRDRDAAMTSMAALNASKVAERGARRAAREKARRADEAARRAEVPPPKLVLVPDDPVSFRGFDALEAIHTGCNWPVGDPGDPEFHFCGADRNGKGPYCLAHGAVAYVKAHAMRPIVEGEERQPRRGPKVRVGRLGLWA